MVSSWLIGVLGLSDSFAKVLFLRENNLPDVGAIIRGLGDEANPVAALWYLFDASYLRALGEAAKVAFPLCVGKLILSVLLVITSAMAMSGRPGSRILTIQAHLAYAALSGATFWLLRDVRYAAIDVMVSVHPLLPKLLAAEPPRAVEATLVLFSKPSLILLSRLSLAVFGIGALLVGVLALTTARTKAFFEAVAAATEEPEDL
jgi:hypothetical protein